MDLPKPNDPFRWAQASGGPVLICEPLSALAAHAFTTRGWTIGQSAGGRDDERGWELVAEAAGGAAARLARVRQVHDTTAVGAAVALSAPHDADIIVSDDPTIAAAVQAADCTPLLAADQRSGAVAAAHAGWRGMAARVPREMLRAMNRSFGTRPADLIVALGPSIGACCYEVGPDVYARFAAAAFGADRLARWFVPYPAATERNRSIERVDAHPRPGHAFFDGWACMRDQLIDEGISSEHIHAAGLCTASHPDAFCSYRRDGAAAGRMAAVIRPRT